MGLLPAPIAIESYPSAERVGAWQEALGSLALKTDAGAGSGLGGSLVLKESSTSARLALISSRAQRLSHLAGEKDRPILLVLGLRGRGRLAAARRSFEVAEGDLYAIDLAAPWSLDFRSDFELVALELRRSRLTAGLGRSRIVFPLVLGTSVAGLAARPVLRTLASNVDILGPADLTAAETAISELVASALLSEFKASDGALTQVQAAHFRRVAAAIDSRIAEPDLSMGDIARREGMSVRYLQRLFERRGESFSDFVRQQRLERSRADLLDPNHLTESIAEIAHRWGFRDQAHFSRSFSAAFGAAPRELRRNLGEGESAQPRRGKPPSTTAARSLRSIPRPAFRGPARPRSELPPVVLRAAPEPDRHYLAANSSTVHWGFISRAIPPVLRVKPGAVVTIETLTQHGNDDHARMVEGDPGAESVFAWTSEQKNVDRRGAGPMNASIFGRGAGEGFGVHICTGPIEVQGAQPGDVLEVEILDIRPRPSANPLYAGKAFASNASAWWGFQYQDLLGQPEKRETVTIYEIDLADPGHARAVYSYVWTPQTDPFGVVHPTIDYPGVPVDHGSVVKREGILAGVKVPARPHFGFIAVAPRESEMIDSIPPGYFGGNIDNWRLGKGARLFLPVAVEGALLSIGDGHFAQGDGEINGTGLECSLTGEVRIRLHRAGGAMPAHLRGLNAPLIETPEAWVIQSFSHPNYLRDLGRAAQSEVYRRSTVDLALRNTFREARRFLMDSHGFDEDEALSFMSVAVDFGITQVADGNLGAHAIIRKATIDRP